MTRAKRRIEIDESFTTPEPKELEKALQDGKVDLVRRYRYSPRRKPCGPLVDLVLKGSQYLIKER